MHEKTGNTLSIDAAESGDGVRDADPDVRDACVDATAADHCEEAAALLEKPAICDLQSAAGAFNEAFNSALYELEFSRKTIAERSARISELDEAVRSIRSALDTEIGKGQQREAEHAQETGQLTQRIEAVESERDALTEKVREQEASLGERADEIAGLHSRVAELNATIEENAAAARRAQDDFTAEKEALTGKLNELQGLYEALGSQSEKQKHELEERDREITAFRSQIDKLLAEAESRDNEVAQLKQQVAGLQDEVNAQAEAMRMQAESHAAACEELNARITGATGELETLRALHADLQEHSEKLENLNQALHESSVTEKAVHKQQLEEKAAQIESLRLRLETTAESPDGQAVDMEGMEALQQSLHELETRLDETVALHRESVIKTEKAGRLEELDGRLRTELRKAREYVTQNREGSRDLVSLHELAVDLQAELGDACAREKDLADRLHTSEAAVQEVNNPEGTAAENHDLQSASAAAGDQVAELKVELERLGAELSASEERCRQLEAALAVPADADGAGAVSPAVQNVLQDQMTPDRAHFVAQLDALLSREDRSGEHHTLMYVLLDNFIMIRDEIGIMESESVVREVAGIIETYCNSDDVMARFGDCTFAVLCSHSTTDETEERAGRIREEVKSRIFEYGGRSLVTTTSIGVCSVRRNDANPENIISRVDLACDAARLSGGNRVMVSSTIVDEINVVGNDEENREMVRSTLAEDRVKIYYQPISSLRGQAGNQFEVLVRLVDKSGDMILPGEFFAMADSAGYANAVDRFVIDKAVKEMSEHNDEQVKYYIKLTRQSVADNGIADWIMSRIEEYGVKPEQLVFEVAESVLQSDLRNMASLSRALHAVGCKIAIEHYRMTTNLQHLTHVYADYLKIDKDLVGSVDKRGESLAKVTAIVDLATKNNYTTIAEGVESPACLAIIWDLGVSMAQGYFIQAPAGSRVYVDQEILTDCDGDVGNKATFAIT